MKQVLFLLFILALKQNTFATTTSKLAFTQIDIPKDSIAQRKEQKAKKIERIVNRSLFLIGGAFMVIGKIKSEKCTDGVLICEKGFAESIIGLLLLVAGSMMLIVRLITLLVDKHRIKNKK
jgi:hypothetical protein